MIDDGGESGRIYKREAMKRVTERLGIQTKEKKMEIEKRKKNGGVRAAGRRDSQRHMMNGRSFPHRLPHRGQGG